MKNVNNGKLLIILAGLVAVFVVLKIFRSPKLERNLPETLAEIDSSAIDKMMIRPASSPEHEIQLLRVGKSWELKQGEQTGRLEQGGARTAMQSLMSLRPQSLVSKKKDKWKEFGVSDSTGTHVRAFDRDDREVLSIWLGRTGFNRGTMDGFSGAYTYVRRNQDDEVYTVDGFIGSQFNRQFDEWRDKSFLRLKPDSIVRVEFSYPADSSFSLKRENKTWMIDDSKADSARVLSFLSDLRYKNGNSFASMAPASKPDVTINFFQSSGSKMTIQGWKSNAEWTLTSTLQPGVFFKSQESDVKDVLKGSGTFKLQ